MKSNSITESNSPTQELVNALLATSRVLVAISAKSLAEVSNEVTLAQYRSMVVLMECQNMTVAKLAEAVGVAPPTATRMCDRLVKKELIHRESTPEDRREITLTLTPKGHELISKVTEERRIAITKLLRQIPVEDYQKLTDIFLRFAASMEDVPDQNWTVGWEIEN
jgi:DNA-binding MarR family transcriptional regulator